MQFAPAIFTWYHGISSEDCKTAYCKIRTRFSFATVQEPSDAYRLCSARPFPGLHHRPHVILDLPFGQKLLPLADGSVLEMPKLIKAMIPERIVAQFTQYCEEVKFKPFSRSTMLRIWSSCAATVRKSFQRLDYIAADGGKAFESEAAEGRKAVH